MHAATCRSLYAARQFLQAPTCRNIAGVRRPPARGFHTSPAVFRAPAEHEGAATSDSKDNSAKPGITEEQPVVVDGEIATVAGNSSQLNDVSQRPTLRPGYGSAVRRASRNKAPTGLPPLELPKWFWERNVICYGEPEDVTRRLGIKKSSEAVKVYETIDGNALLSLNADDVAVLNIQAISMLEIELQLYESRMKEFDSIIKQLGDKNVNHEEIQHATEGTEAYADQPLELAYSEEFIKQSVILRRNATSERKSQVFVESNDDINLKNPNYWYSVSENVYNEIYSSFCGELKLPPPNINIKDVSRRDTILLCPMEGGTDFLNAVVRKVATTLEADVVRLDAEDIAQILGQYLGEDVAWTNTPTAVLGYGRSRRSDRMEPSSVRNEVEEDEEEEDDDVDAYGIEDSQPDFSAMGKGSPLNTAIAFLESPSRLLHGHGALRTLNLANILGQSHTPSSSRIQSRSSGENWNEYKTFQAMEQIIGAADAKSARKVEKSDNLQFLEDQNIPAAKRLIIQINGYKELNDHPLGYNILNSLREAVKKCWYGGRSVLIVGTISEKLEQSLALAQDLLEDKSSMGVTFDRPRFIFVPPECHHSRIDDDRRAQIRDLNIRHTEHMIMKLLGTDYDSQWTIDLHQDLAVGSKTRRLVEKGVWSYHDVRRIATSMLGTVGSDRVVDGNNLRQVLLMQHSSDNAFFSWANRDNIIRDPVKRVDESIMIDISPDVRKPAKEKDDNLEKLKKQCTPHEKKLLGGVINATEIQTTFADIRAPPESIEALKTLTSLSLLRPDSFSYGVLASDKIPGLLLYGPPGTGKTLLAKAVAKQSGATMLEVSASEINDMYVGESEKNVKALFSLAKKLSPCVVFIDEADSLFGSRGNDFQRRSHRETINQFLREWDGMTNLSTFIMVATNRPFDLDEAVLRRLPRRLLVDLPRENDREAILKIHLKDELLDESVSLATLAKNTPFYSGSDLKNLSVAAALACVREENEMAAIYRGDEPFVYPSRRILRKQHFDKAMEEISASISEDMSTLSAIRKFDERYGDRKGRRKKKSGLGFGGTIDPEPDSEAGRVRKLELAV